MKCGIPLLRRSDGGIRRSVAMQHYNQEALRSCHAKLTTKRYMKNDEADAHQQVKRWIKRQSEGNL